MIQHIDVEFSLLGEAGKGQVAAAKVANSRVDWIRAEEQIQLGVKRVPQEQLHDDLMGLDLNCQAAQACLISIRRRAEHELLAKMRREFLLQADCRLIVDTVG